MTGVTPPDLLDKIWEYPLFEALYGRRSRRFGLGFEMAEGPYKYKSQRLPLALTEMEEEILVAAGVGFSGSALWDQSRPFSYRAGEGRTFPSTSHGRCTALFFTNDRGIYVIDPTAPPVTKRKVVDVVSEREEVLSLYGRHRKTLQQKRLNIPRRVPPLSGHNLWDSNMSGSTLFMPICDISRSLISLIAQFVDRQLEHYAAKEGRGAYIVDDRNDFRPAGTEHWLKNEFLDGERMVPLSHLERQACYYMFSEPAIICQNMFLATEAIGLGGWMHCGFQSREIFEALGFRFAPAEISTMANPIGIDSIFQAHCPPYFSSMDDAVDAVLMRMLRTSQARSSSAPDAAPYLISYPASGQYGCCQC